MSTSRCPPIQRLRSSGSPPARSTLRSYEPELLLARNQNEPLVSVAALVQKPLTSIVSLGSKHITRVSQLRGKRVGDAGLAYQHDYLTTILGGARVQPNSVKEVNVGQDLVPAMLSGRVDATIGAYWNVEALQLQRMGKHPNVVHMEQVGIPTYDELVLVVRTATLTQRPDVVRRFVQALARGYESARRDPAAAAHNLPGVNPKLALASVRATLPAFFPADPAQPWGYQNPLHAMEPLRSMDAGPSPAHEPQCPGRRLDE